MFADEVAESDYFEQRINPCLKELIEREGESPQFDARFQPKLLSKQPERLLKELSSTQSILQPCITEEERRRKLPAGGV